MHSTSRASRGSWGVGALVLLGATCVGGAALAGGQMPLPPGALSRVGAPRIGAGAEFEPTYDGLPSFALLRRGELVAYPDGHHVLVFEVATGRFVRRIPGSVAVRRLDDDHVFTLVPASSGDEKRLTLWDLRQDPPKAVYAIPKAEYPPAVLSTNASRVAFFAPDNAVLEVHDARSGKKIGDLPDAGRLFDRFALSNTGKYVVAYVPKRLAIVVWHVEKNKRKWIRLPEKLRRPLKPNGGAVVRLQALSPDAKTLALGVENERATKPAKRFQLHFLRTTTGKILRAVSQAARPKVEPANVAELSRDGSLFFAKEVGLRSLLLAVKTGAPPTGWAKNAGEEAGTEIWASAFDPDGSRLALARIARGLFKIDVWDTATGKRLTVPKGLGDLPVALRFASDGAKLISLWRAGTLRTSTVADGNMASERAAAPGVRGEEAQTHALDHHGNAVVGFNTAVRVKGPHAGLLKTGPISDLSVAETSPRLATAGDSGLTVWNIDNGKKTWVQAVAGSPQGVQLSPDGALLLARVRPPVKGFVPDVRVVYAIGSARPLHRFESGSGQAAFSPDNKALAIGNEVYSTKTWKKLVTLPTKGEGEVTAVRFSPDSALLAVGAASGRIGIFAASGKALRTLEGHLTSVTCLAWSKDGKTLASGSYDTTVLCWDLSGL